MNEKKLILFKNCDTATKETPCIPSIFLKKEVFKRLLHNELFRFSIQKDLVSLNSSVFKKKRPFYWLAYISLYQKKIHKSFEYGYDKWGKFLVHQKL